MRGEGDEEVPSVAAPPLPMAVRRRDFRRERVRSGPNDMAQDSVPDCAWRSGMEHATVLEGERKVCPIDDSSRMLAPRPGLTSGLTSGQWLSITDIPWLRAVCEDPAVPFFCFDCPWSCKADPRVGYCSKATHHMFCLLQLLSSHRNHAAAAGYSRSPPPQHLLQLSCRKAWEKPGSMARHT